MRYIFPVGKDDASLSVEDCMRLSTLSCSILLGVLLAPFTVQGGRFPRRCFDSFLRQIRLLLTYDQQANSSESDELTPSPVLLLMFKIVQSCSTTNFDLSGQTHHPTGTCTDFQTTQYRSTASLHSSEHVNKLLYFLFIKEFRGSTSTGNST